MGHLTPGLVDVRWGRHRSERFDMLKHATIDAGGNPCLVFHHGGGARNRDKRLPWLQNAAGNHLFDFLLNTKTAPTDRHFHCISVETPQSKWESPVDMSSHPAPTTWTAPWYLPPENDTGAGAPNDTREVQSVPKYFPDSWFSMKRFVQWLKDTAATYDIDPNKLFLMGSSYGAQLSSWSQITGPLRGVTSAEGQAGRDRGDFYRNDSRVRGVVTFQFVPDIRTVGGTDTVHYSHIEGYFGTFGSGAAAAQAAWNAIPDEQKQTVSPLYFVENGFTSWWVPHYGVWQQVGNGIKPYGDPGIGGSDPHDSAQGTTWESACAAKGLTNTVEIVPVNDWTDLSPSAAAAISGRVYDWMVGILRGTIV